MINRIKTFSSDLKELHKALQLVSIVPRSYLSEDSSDSNAALNWDEERGALVSRSISGVHTGIRIKDFTYIIYNKKRSVEIVLTEESYSKILQDIEREVGGMQIQKVKLISELPYDLPNDVEKKGNPFGKPSKNFLAHYSLLMSCCFSALNILCQKIPQASEVVCWPHHFDIATLVSISEKDEEKSIGMGFSPGDDSVEYPYLYVNLWPYPEAGNLPNIKKPAKWITDGWVGIVSGIPDDLPSVIDSYIRSFFVDNYKVANRIL